MNKKKTMQKDSDKAIKEIAIEKNPYIDISLPKIDNSAKILKEGSLPMISSASKLKTFKLKDEVKVSPCFSTVWCISNLSSRSL